MTEGSGRTHPVSLASYQLERLPPSNTRIGLLLSTSELRRRVARLELLARQASNRHLPRGGLSVRERGSADWSPRAARLSRTRKTLGRYPKIHSRSTISEEQKAVLRADSPRLVTKGAR